MIFDAVDNMIFELDMRIISRLFLMISRIFLIISRLFLIISRIFLIIYRLINVEIGKTRI